MGLLHQESQQGRTNAIRAGGDARVLDRSRRAAAGFDPMKRAVACAAVEYRRLVDASETTPGDVLQSFCDPVEAPVFPTHRQLLQCLSMSQKKRQLTGSALLSA